MTEYIENRMDDQILICEQIGCPFDNKVAFNMEQSQEKQKILLKKIHECMNTRNLKIFVEHLLKNFEDHFTKYGSLEIFQNFYFEKNGLYQKIIRRFANELKMDDKLNFIENKLSEFSDYQCESIKKQMRSMTEFYENEMEKLQKKLNEAEARSLKNYKEGSFNGVSETVIPQYGCGFSL